MYIYEEDVKDILQAIINPDKTKTFERFFKELYEDDKRDFIKKNLQGILKENLLGVVFNTLIKDDELLGHKILMNDHLQDEQKKMVEFFWTKHVNKAKDSMEGYLKLFEQPIPIAMIIYPFCQETERLQLLEESYIMKELHYDLAFKENINHLITHLFISEFSSKNPKILKTLNNYSYKGNLDLYETYDYYDLSIKNGLLKHNLIFEFGQLDCVEYIFHDNYDIATFMSQLIKVSNHKSIIEKHGIKNVYEKNILDGFEEYKHIKQETINVFFDHFLENYFDLLTRSEKEKLVQESIHGEKSKMNALLKKMNTNFDDYECQHHFILNNINNYSNKLTAKRLFTKYNVFDIFSEEYGYLESNINSFWNYHSYYDIPRQEMCDRILNEIFSKKPSQILCGNKFDKLDVPEDLKKYFLNHKAGQMFCFNSYMIEDVFKAILDLCDLKTIDKNYQNKRFNELTEPLEQYKILEKLLSKTMFQPLCKIESYQNKYETFPSLAAEIFKKNNNNTTVEKFFKLRQDIQNSSFTPSEKNYILSIEKEIDIFLKEIIHHGAFLNSKKTIFDECVKWIDKNPLNLEEVLPKWHEIKDTYRENFAKEFLILKDNEMILGKVYNPHEDRHIKPRKI